MSYMQCQKCGGMFGVINRTVYTCQCLPESAANKITFGNPTLHNTGNSIAGDPIYSDVPPSLPEAVAGNASAPVGDQKEQHLDPWDEPHTVKTPVGEHGPSCEFIKDGKGTCGPNCGQPSGVGEPLHVFKEFENAVKYLQEHGYSDWDGTANGQEITLTGCANMMRQYKRDLPLVAAREVGEGLREAANRAYCNYIDKLRTPECLGHEQKLKEGSFGIAELVAHRDAAELLGRHRAFAEAAALAAPAPKPAPPVQPSCKCSTLDGQGICNACADMLRQQVQRQREINAELVKPAPPAQPRSLAASANWIQNVYEPWRRAAERKPPR